MGLGSTAQKLQAMAERAEQLYAQVMELRDQIADLRETVEDTGRDVDELMLRSEKQWALLQAIADEQGIDVDSVLTEAAIEEIEPPAGEATSEAEEEGDA